MAVDVAKLHTLSHQDDAICRTVRRPRTTFPDTGSCFSRRCSLQLLARRYVLRAWTALGSSAAADRRSTAKRRRKAGTVGGGRAGLAPCGLTRAAAVRVEGVRGRGCRARGGAQRPAPQWSMSAADAPGHGRRATRCGPSERAPGRCAGIARSLESNRNGSELGIGGEKTSPERVMSRPTSGVSGQSPCHDGEACPRRACRRSRHAARATTVSGAPCVGQPRQVQGARRSRGSAVAEDERLDPGRQ